MSILFVKQYKGYKIYRRDSSTIGLICHFVRFSKIKGVYFACGNADVQIKNCEKQIDMILESGKQPKRKKEV